MSDEIEWKPMPRPVRPTPETPVTPESDREAPSRDADQQILAEKASAAPETPEDKAPHVPTDERLSMAFKRLQTTFIPPDIVRFDRPSLLKVIDYARSGDWGPAKGPVRNIGVAYSLIVCVPMVALFYSMAWTIERPARTIAVSLLGASLWWWFA